MSAEPVRLCEHGVPRLGCRELEHGKRDATTGVCTECKSPPEAYHSRGCSQFNGYHCDRCNGTYHGEFCPQCPPPWWVKALGGAE